MVIDIGKNVMELASLAGMKIEELIPHYMLIVQIQNWIGIGIASVVLLICYKLYNVAIRSDDVDKHVYYTILVLMGIFTLSMSAIMISHIVDPLPTAILDMISAIGHINK